MNATYVFCVVAASRRPRVVRVPPGLPGMGPVRLLEISRGLFAVVADAPVRRYGETAINRGLADIEWVSRAAVAHEAVVEHFIDATAVLPMKLFTLYTNDERALHDLRGARVRLTSTVKRVAHHQEWGVRVLLDRARAATSRKTSTARVKNGVAYLTQKKASRDAANELAQRARDTVGDLYDRLAARARDARRRTAAELPAQGSLLLDAAFLVPRTRAATFRALAAKQSRALAPYGYAVTLSGPWPPYTFVQD